MTKKVSGYVRSFNTGDVFLINIMGYSLGLALCSNPSFIGSNGPTASIGLVIFLGALLAVCNGLLYGWFSALFPSAGGDYVFISRSLGSKIAKITGIGFLSSFGFTICQIYGLSSNLQLIPEMALTPCIEALGLPYEITQTTSQYLPFLLCLGYFIIAIVSPSIKFVRCLLWPFFILGMMGPIIMMYSFWTTSNDSFISAYNEYMNDPKAYNNVIGAISLNYDNKLSDTFKSLPLGFLCFMGFTYSVYSGSEVSNPKRSQIKGIMIALFVGIITFLIGMTGYVNMVGQEFHANIGQVSNFGFSLQTAASLIIDNRLLNILMNIGITVWWIAVPYVIFQVCVHNIVAWAADDIVPRRFLRRWNDAPIYPALCVLIISELILFVALRSNGSIFLTDAVALASITFFLAGLSAFKLNPDSDLYQRLPESAKSNFLFCLPISWFTGLGFVCVIAFACLFAKAIYYPEGGSLYSALFWTIGIYLIGFIYYRLRIKKLQKMDDATVDKWDETIFQQIPDDIDE